MKTKYLTKTQCERIIANNYLGEHNRKGRQVDYGDSKEEIDKRLWELNQKSFDKKVKESLALADLNEFESMPKVEFDFNRIFNKWRYISNKIIIDSF